MDTTKYRIRYKVLIPLTLSFAVLIAAFIWASYGIRRTDEQHILQQHFWSAQSVLNGLIREQTKLLASTAKYIASQPELQAAIAADDIDQLTRISVPLLERLTREIGMTHFYYHDAQGDLLLRVYLPADRSQPKVRRKNLQRAMLTDDPSAGLEIGSHGTFAQRLVVPWYKDAQLLGYIELGIDLRHIFEKLKNITQVDVTVAIDKSAVPRAKWQAYREKNPATLRWDFLADKLISDTTLRLSQSLAEKIFTTTEYGTLDDKLVNDINGRHVYRGLLMPISDKDDMRLGEMAMLVDVTDQQTVFYGFLWRIIGFSLLISGLLFVFAYRILGRVSRQLISNEEQLEQKSATLADNNQRLSNEIQEREQAQQQLLELNQHLEQRVHERTLELATKNRELETSRQSLETAYRELKEQQATILHQDKMACIGQLAAGIAHDINNPIGFVSHNLGIFERYLERFNQFFSLQRELLKNRGDADMIAACSKGWQDFHIDKMLTEMPTMLAECRDGTTRISQTVQSLRTFSRTEVPRHELTDLHQCLDSTLAIIRHELRAKISVERLYGELPKRYCYPGQINQVFLNLLINASQAIAEQGTITIKTWTENQQIYIAIADTGAGIPAEVLEHIFEPFFTTKEVGVGTGLGLSIVYDIIARHQGVIDVTSTVGVGTTFTIRLPFDERAKPRDVEGSIHD